MPSDDAAGVDLGSDATSSDDAVGVDLGSDAASDDDAGGLDVGDDDPLGALPDAIASDARLHRNVVGRGGLHRLHLPDLLKPGKLDVEPAVRRILKRVLEREVEADTVKAQAASAVGHAFDCDQLLHGNKVTPSAELRHANAWDHGNTVKLACESIGTAATHAIRITSHVDVAMGATATTAEWATRQCVRDFAQSIKMGVRTLHWLFVRRSWDGTPFDVEFGRLEAALCPVARFRYKEPGSSDWQLISYEEATAKKRRCKVGVLECLGQTAQLVWREPAALTDASSTRADELVTRIEEPVIPPRYLASAKASCQFEAFEGVLPELSIEALKDLSQYIKYVALACTYDNSSPNGRMTAYIESLVLEHNDAAASRNVDHRILFLVIICVGHILTRAVIGTFGYVQLIPKCYAIAFVI